MTDVIDASDLFDQIRQAAARTDELNQARAAEPIAPTDCHWPVSRGYLNTPGNCGRGAEGSGDHAMPLCWQHYGLLLREAADLIVRKNGHGYGLTSVVIAVLSLVLGDEGPYPAGRHAVESAVATLIDNAAAGYSPAMPFRDGSPIAVAVNDLATARVTQMLGGAE